MEKTQDMSKLTLEDVQWLLLVAAEGCPKGKARDVYEIIIKVCRTIDTDEAQQEAARLEKWIEDREAWNNESTINS